MTTQKQRSAARRNLAKAHSSSAGNRSGSTTRSASRKGNNGSQGPAMGRQRTKGDTHVYH